MNSAQTEPWYKRAFQSDYLERYAHRDEEEARQIFTLAQNCQVLRKDQLILDLCCGAGRHSQVFCDEGYRVVGLDLSRDLLASAKEKPCRKSRFIQADMRYHPFSTRSFHGILHLFTAFGYFQEDDENFAVFSEVSRILQPNGWYLFDYLNATAVKKTIGSCEHLLEEVHPTLGRMRTAKALNAKGNRIRKKIEFLDSAQRESIEEDVALYSATQLLPVLKHNGLRLEQQFGDYRGTAYSDHSPRWIALCRKG